MPNTAATSSAARTCTSSSPVCARWSKPQNFTRTQASSFAATGQPSSHVERATTRAGAGDTTFAR